MNIFAHAEELHTQTTSETEHLLTEPLFAVPLFIVMMIGLYFALSALKVSKPSIMLIELAILFFVGIGTYTLIPALSIFALTVGITAALFITLSSISNG